MLPLLTAALLSAADHTGASGAPDPLGRGAWLIDPTEDAVLLVTPRAGVERFEGCAWPSQLLVDEGGAAYVTCRQSGEVRRLRSHEPQTAWPVGAEPSGLALDAAAGRLYVGLVTEHAVVMLDASSGAELGRARLGVEPSGVALYGPGLVVTSRKSDTVRIYPRGLDAAPVERRLRSPRVDPEVPVAPTGELLVPESSRMIIVAPVAELGAVPQPTYYSSGRGSPVTHDLFVLDDQLRLERLRNVVLPDVAGAVVSGGALMMASRGLGGVISVPLGGGSITMDWDAPGGTVALARDRAGWVVLNDVSREVIVSGARPEASVPRFGTAGSPRQRADVERIALGGGGDPELARGRELFHKAGDYRISSASLACASCHRDGRDDGHTWLGQDSMRQTPMLAGRDLAHTAPYGWSGQYQRLEQYIEFTIGERMLGDGLSKKDLLALTRYVREGLRPVSRPPPPSERADEVRRGRVVFHADATGCSTCHGAHESFTDGAIHDVGSIGAAERRNWHQLQLRLGAVAPPASPPPRASRVPLSLPIGKLTMEQFYQLMAAENARKAAVAAEDAALQARPRYQPIPRSLRRYETPSLMQLAMTAPYLHDGSAPTLDDVFTRLGDHMGTVSNLTARERSDLVAYLETL